MVSAIVAFLVSLGVTGLLTPFVREWAIHRGVVDAPGGRRVHAAATPRLGGIAIMFGFFAPLALLLSLETELIAHLISEPKRVAGLAGGALIVGVVGARDDLESIGPWPKLAAQTVAACVAFAFGYRIDAINLPGLGTLELGMTALPVTVAWFLGVINALNLIDGLDGLASGIAFFAATANGVIAYVNDAHVVVLLSAALAGSLLGFLRYNFSPATIFMGDSGSMFLGFVLAATSLVGATIKSSTAVAILAPLVALGVPIFDTMLTMIRRTLARQPVFSADRGHIHHVLIDLGLTHRRAVLILYGFTLALCCSAIAIAFGRNWHVGSAIVVVFCMIVMLARTVRRGQVAASLLSPTLGSRGALPEVSGLSMTSRTRRPEA